MTNDSQRPWPLARALGLFCAAALALASPWALGVVTIPWDAKAHFYPQLVFLAKSLHAGDSPFWNPYVFAGSPQIADPQSLIFSPPYLLLALVDAAPGMAAFDAVVFAALAAGGVGVLLIFRDRNWHPAAALVAALAFSFGASAAWRVQHVGQILSLSFLPLALWALMRALDRGSFRWGLLAGLLAGFMVLGRDQVALLGVWTLVFYVLGHVLRTRQVWASLKPLAGGFLSGLATVAIPVAMTATLAAVSNRSSIDLDGAGRGSLHPASFFTLVSANLFGTDGPLKDFWGPPSPAWGPLDLFLARNMADVYMGALPAFALIVLVLTRGLWRERAVRFFLAGLALSVLYALGRYTPFYQLAYYVPGADLFRRPADATFLIGFFGAMVAGYALHRWLTDETLRAGGLRRIVGFALLAATFVAAGALASFKGQMDVAAPALRFALLCFAAALLGLALARRLALFPAMIVLAGVTAADLALNNGPNESTALPPAMYDVLAPGSKSETIAFLKERIAATSAPDRRDRVELTGIDFHWPNAGMAHGFENVLGYNPLRLKIFTDATNAGDHVALVDQRNWSPLFANYRSPLVDMLGLRYIALGAPVEQVDRAFRPGDLTLLRVIEEGGKTIRVYENPSALPRVLFATEARQADFAAMAAGGGWPDVDFRRTVLIEGAPPPASAGEGRARILSYRNTDVQVEVEAPQGGGFLVLNDVWHPWWEAELDGTSVPLLRANVMFRAVAVPAGRHVVRFAFRPFAGLWRQARSGGKG